MAQPVNERLLGLQLALLRQPAVLLGIPLAAAKRTYRDGALRTGFDPFRTSDGNASPGLRARDLVPETDQGLSHCRGKLNGLSTNSEEI
jgi:hypothetical protein